MKLQSSVTKYSGWPNATQHSSNIMFTIKCIILFSKKIQQQIQN
jgi:hypothetical protein